MPRNLLPYFIDILKASVTALVLMDDRRTHWFLAQFPFIDLFTVFESVNFSDFSIKTQQLQFLC